MRVLCAALIVVGCSCPEPRLVAAPTTDSSTLVSAYAESSAFVYAAKASQPADFPPIVLIKADSMLYAARLALSNSDCRGALEALGTAVELAECASLTADPYDARKAIAVAQAECRRGGQADG